jgi:hypothetical protein
MVAPAADITRGSKEPKNLLPRQIGVAHSTPANKKMSRIATSSAADSSTFYNCGLHARPIPVAKSGPKCFRVSNVPLKWSEKKLSHALHAADRSLRDQKYQLSLYPACSGSTKTALLNFDTCPESFERICPNCYEHLKCPETSTTLEAHLVIDCHFHDLTPLNTPQDEIVAELVLSSATIPKDIDINRMQCGCCNRSCRARIWVLEKPGNPFHVAERLLAQRYHEHQNYDIWL